MSKHDEAVEGRRSFLKLAVAAPAAAAAAATIAPDAAEAAEVKTGGMQDTPHTRAYYDSARF